VLTRANRFLIAPAEIANMACAVAAFALLTFSMAQPGLAQNTSSMPAAAPSSVPAAASSANGAGGSTMNDPRAVLKPGFYDAGEAALGMEHVAFVKKPDAFQAPPPKPDAKPMERMFAQLGYSNSDMAFEGNHLFLGNFYGVNFYDISNPAKISLATSLVCPGGQGDVSVYGHLLFMSVEMPNGRVDCGTQGFPPMPPPDPDEEKKPAEQRRPRIPAADPARFRGVRIFDISDFNNPKQVAAVQTCRGSHTHTLVTDPNNKEKVYVYVSGTSFVRPAEELAGCSGEAPDKDPNTALFRIDVIEVPLAAPQQAKIVSTPRVFMNPRTGEVNSLSNAGNHDKPEAKPAETNQCHDITAYSAIGLAAGACSGNGLLLDIKDPVNPVRIDAVNDKNYSYWHSATFSNDGKKVLFTDEWGGGLQPRCRTKDPLNWGADALFNIVDGKLQFASYYKMPAAQTETENCVAHNGSLVPVPGRDIEVQAWYQGGISVVDFTDVAHPKEIAYFDRGPLDAKNLMLGGDWSAYWYNGYIYGSEIARGVDVFRLLPSQYLSADEIAAANLVHFDELNVQSQQRMTWPASLVVARAYADQLGRSQALPAKRVTELRKQIDRTEKSHNNPKQIAKLNAMGTQLESESQRLSPEPEQKRAAALAEILKHPSQ
jgi:hypothetical protein